MDSFSPKLMASPKGIFTIFMHFLCIFKLQSHFRKTCVFSVSIYLFCDKKLIVTLKINIFKICKKYYEFVHISRTFGVVYSRKSSSEWPKWTTWSSSMAWVAVNVNFVNSLQYRFVYYTILVIKQWFIKKKHKQQVILFCLKGYWICGKYIGDLYKIGNKFTFLYFVSFWCHF